jgi:hypothetical protein
MGDTCVLLARKESTTQVLHYSLISMAALAPTVITVRIMGILDSKSISESFTLCLLALVRLLTLV